MRSTIEVKKKLREVLFEFVIQGNYVKVIAVDPISNTEIAIVGDRRRGRDELQRVAIKKLIYVIEKNARELIEKENPDEDLH